MSKFKLGDRVVVYDKLERRTGRVCWVAIGSGLYVLLDGEHEAAWFYEKQLRRLVKKKRVFAVKSEHLFPVEELVGSPKMWTKVRVIK